MHRRVTVVPVLHRSQPWAALIWAAVAAGGLSAAAQDSANRTLSAQVPLRVVTTVTVPLRAGQRFHGTLAEPVYGPDRLLLAEGTQIDGVVAATPAADRATRIHARLDGDFTPLRVPLLRVTELHLPSGAVLAVHAEGGLRAAAVIHLGWPPASASLWRRARSLATGQIRQARDSVDSARQEPHKGDRLKRILYSELPYHPQRVWAGSTFDAVLQSPVTVPADAAAPPLVRASAVDLSRGTLEARLGSGISSAASRRKDPVSAVLTRPFCDAQGRLMLPAGTRLTGQVLEATPARRLARNGKLRFAFRSVAVPPSPDEMAVAAPTPPPAGQVSNTDTHPPSPPRLRERPATVEQRIQGNLTSVEATPGENIALDAEGGARAQPDQGRFLAPLILGVMAAASQGDDGSSALRSGVSSNGFGLLARVATAAAASRNASTGFAAYAFLKSVYRRYLGRGHEVTFPANTELTIALGR